MALAASSTVLALAGSGGAVIFNQSAIKLLPLSLVSWPGICDLLPMVPECRSALQQALMLLAVRAAGWRQTCRPVITRTPC